MKKKYPEAVNAIDRYIREHALLDGDRLPAEKRLAEVLGLNHITVRKALSILAGEEKVHTVPCRGNFVGKAAVRSSRTRLVGLLVPDPDSFFYDIIAALEYRISMFDYSPLIHFSRRSRLREESALNSMCRRKVEGIIAVPDRNCADLYAQLKIPLIFFDNMIEGLNIPYVINDDFQAALSATEHLISLGHRRIAHLGGNEVHSSFQRLNGFRTALERHAIPIAPELILSREYSREWGYTAAETLFRSPHPPTAVFCGNDSIASGLLRYLLTYGIACPQEVSVIGCCNAPFSEDIGLTTVDQQTSQLAECLWNSLYTAMTGKQLPPAIIIPSRLLLRRTTAIPAAGQATG